MVFASRLLRMAGSGTFASAKPAREYQWHDVTNPAYNGFFHGVLPKVQGAVLTGGGLYGVYLVMFCEAQR